MRTNGQCLAALRKGAVDVAVVVTGTLCVVPADVVAGPAHTSRNRQTPRPAYTFLWMCQTRLHRKRGMTGTTCYRTMSLEGTAPHSPIEGNPRRRRGSDGCATATSWITVDLALFTTGPWRCTRTPRVRLETERLEDKDTGYQPPETTCGRHRSSHWNQNKTPTTRRDSDINEAPRS